jgi:hypothetical protein
MNGKGDKPRPVDKKKYDANHDAIRWKSKASSEKQAVSRPKRAVGVSVKDA